MKYVLLVRTYNAAMSSIIMHKWQLIAVDVTDYAIVYEIIQLIKVEGLGGH